MAARAGAGTAVGLAVCVGGGGLSNGVKHVKMNNAYFVGMSHANPPLMSLTRNGTSCFSGITQSEFQQLWQDMSQLGSTQ